MSDVFISYARSEKDRARQIAQALKRKALAVWWDRQVFAGDRWADQIERELSGARCVVVLWSRESVRSLWVKEEASYAHEVGSLIPVLLEKVEVPLRFRGIHAIDLSDWDGSSDHPGIDMLTAVVEERIS
jgi:hypothetical protein